MCGMILSKRRSISICENLEDEDQIHENHIKEQEA